MEKQIPKILIVDDDSSLIELLSDILRLKGFEPLTALNGASALQSIEQNHIHVVVIDLRLGDMSGLDVLREIKSRSPETECIMLTGHSSQDSAIDAVQMGAFGYFLKPFDMEQVLLTIKHAVDKHDAVINLRESERFAHSTVDALSSHIAILDETGTIVAVNRAWRTFAESNSPINSRPNLFEGVNYLSVCESSHGENSEGSSEMAAGIRAVMSGELTEFSLEYPCHSPQEQRWFNARVTRFPANGALRTVVAHENITKRMLAEEAVRQSEARFHALIQNAADLIVVIDAEGVVQYVSPSSERILGYREQEFIGKKFHEWLHPEDLPLANQSLLSRRDRAGTAEKSIEVRSRHIDGTWHVIEVLGTNLLAEPAVHGIVMNIRDVTERKKIDEALYLNEQRYRGLFEDSPTAIWEEDFSEVKQYLDSLKQQGVTDFRKYFTLHPDAVVECAAKIKILDVNKAAVQMFKAESKQALIKNTHFDHSKGEEEHNSEDFAAIAEGKTSNSWEGSDETLTGEPIEISLSWSISPGHEQDLSRVIVTTLDITERKLAEDGLRKSEALLSEAQRIGKIGHWEWSAPSDELICSDEMFNILEIPLHGRKITQKIIKSLVHPEDLQKLRKLDAEIFAQRSNIDYEYRILLTGESVRWIHQQARINYGEDGQPIRMMGVLQDITERKLAEEAQRKNEERYRLLFESAPVGIFSATLQGQIVEINPVALQILGSASAEATKSINLLTFPLLVESGFSANFQNCAETGRSIFAEQSYTSQWGKFVYAQYRMTPIFDVNGRVALIQVILEDITERKLNEDQIHKLAFMLDTAPNSITVHDFGGNFLMANQRTFEMHGYTRDEFMTLSLHEVDVPESEQLISARMQELHERGEAIFEADHYRKDGSILPLEVSVRIANWGDQQAILSIATDITERKQAEQITRQQSEQLRLLYEASQRLNRTLDLNEIYQAVCDFMSSIAANDGLIVSAFDSETQLITCRAYWMENKWLDVSSFPSIPLEEEGRGTQSRVIRSGQSMLINDYEAYQKTASIVYYVDSETNKMVDEAPADDEEITRSALIVPLKAGDKVNGVIQVTSYRLNAYTENQLKLLESLALHIVSAQKNALLYAQVQIELNERKQAEVALRESEEQYRTLVEQLPAIVFIDDANSNGRTMYISPQIETILGFSPQQWQEESPDLWSRQVHPDDHARVHEAYMRCLQNGEKYDAEYRIYAADGRQLWFRDQAFMLRDESDKPKFIHGVMYDITDRKQSEEAIRQRVVELGLLYESGLAFIKLLHPKEIAQEIINLLEQKMDWHHTAIRLYDRATNTMQLLAFNQPGLTNVDEISALEHQLKGGVTRVGQGLSGWAIQHDQTVRAGDLENDDRYVEIMPGMKSGLYVPIKLGDHVIGVVSIESEKPNAFSEADERLTETLANQAASALENARLFDETHQHIMELTALHRTGQTLLASRLDAEQIYAAVHQAVAQTMSCEAFVIVLDDKERGQYRAVYFFDKGDRFPARWLPREQGLSGRVISSGETLLIADTAETDLQATHFGSMESSRSILAVPLRRGKEIIGMISTQSYQPHAFSESQQILLETMAGQLSSALDNANLYEQTRARINELETLYETSKVLSAEYDLNALLEIIVDRTEAMLNASTSGMYLYDAESQELVLTMDTSPFINVGLRLRLGEGVAGRVAQTGQPIRIGDYSTWEGRSPKFDDTPIHAVIEVPMLYAGELIGVLTADESGDSGRKFTEADERLLSLFASQAAGAINAARHRADVIRYAEELEQRVLERTAEIEATRQRLDLAAGAGGIGVWEINIKENTVFWDMRMHIIQGTDPAQFDNSLDAWMQTIYPEDLAYVTGQFQDAIMNTGRYSLEHRIVRADGSLRYISANAVVVYDEKHIPERMIGVNMDVTERKLAEDEIHRANLEMERAMRTKDEFLANMSHELRTPLNSILGISESLEEQISGTLNEKQLRYIGIVKESGRHLLELITDILDISKVEAGRMELDLQNVSVEKLCQASLRLVKELAQKKSLKVSFETLTHVDIVFGDERRLKQSLVNLLSNAVKFTPAGSHIGLEVCGHPKENEVTFTVWDQGVGIAQEDMQYLFKPFVQLDAGLAREYQGTGLGLALVAQMIRLHGGRVDLQSKVGEGSRFTITLPWLPEQQNLHSKSALELPHPMLKSDAKRNGRLLLVEDTEVISSLMNEYLRYKGYQVFMAKNGMEGFLLAKKENPDLILMDVMMPVMDGMEATKLIREVDHLKNTPIIALTALAMPGDRERCFAAGMTDYLSKPIRIQELADMIDKHLTSKGQPPNEQ